MHYKDSRSTPRFSILLLFWLLTWTSSLLAQTILATSTPTEFTTADQALVLNLAGPSKLDNPDRETLKRCVPLYQNLLIQKQDALRQLDEFERKIDSESDFLSIVANYRNGLWKEISVIRDMLNGGQPFNTTSGVHNAFSPWLDPWGRGLNHFFAYPCCDTTRDAKDFLQRRRNLNDPQWRATAIAAESANLIDASPWKDPLVESLFFGTGFWQEGSWHGMTDSYRGWANLAHSFLQREGILT